MFHQKKSILSLFRLALGGAILWGCATESAPLGGKEDTEAPKVKAANPPDKSVNFTSKQIEIRFNEYLQNNGFTQTVISPAVEPKPEIKLNGKSLFVKLKGSLQPNTTYTINFVDDVKDLNAGNVFQNFTYVFSTGSYIDSQSISGKVKTAHDDTDADGVIVGLYQTDNLLPVLSERPKYFAKTNKAGMFTINNVKPGEYAVFAVKDQNGNLVYDQPNELVGFLDTLLQLTDTFPQFVNLLVFNQHPNKPKILTYKNSEPGKLTIKYNTAISKFRADSKLFFNGFQAWNSNEKDSITIWFSDYYTKFDSVFLCANDTTFDTLRLELKTLIKDSVLQQKKHKLSIHNQQVKSLGSDKSVATLPQLTLYEPLKFNLSRPVLSISDSKTIQITVDSSQDITTKKFWLDKTTKQTLYVDFERKPNTLYKLIIPDSLLRDVWGIYNDKMEQRFTTNSSENYGNIKLTIKTAEQGKKYVLKILNSADVEVAVYYLDNVKEKTDVLKNLPEGNYKAVVFEDTNENGEWDTGNLSQRKQPEKVIPFKDTYTLKGGWDLDLELNLQQTETKPKVQK
ncbi:MAG: Ig-like domain-containing protein [Chitinophagales bacterium]|nr:Ig-like domain-containing protein [Chitinophagales bacterium]